MGEPVLNPGEPRGDCAQVGSNLEQGVHSIPWPWMTGYITITPGFVGGRAYPPIESINNQYTLPENLYSGIINGIYKQ